MVQDEPRALYPLRCHCVRKRYNVIAERGPGTHFGVPFLEIPRTSIPAFASTCHVPAQNTVMSTEHTEDVVVWTSNLL
eukprot:3836769-Rhodomonas_salina.2